MALFKIEKGLAANLTAKRPNSVEGYCYFTTDDGKFYIDIATGTAKTPADNGGQLAGATRMPINSYLSDWAARAYADQDGRNISSSYGNHLSLSGYTLKLITPKGTELATVTLPKNVDSAAKFTTAQKIKITGAVTGEKDSQAGWEIATTLADQIVKTANLNDKAVTNDKIANPSITINGKLISLGGAATLADLGLGSALRFIGITSTAIVDGSTATSVDISGTSVAVSPGDVVINSLNTQEYLWTGKKWELLGDEASYERKGVAQGLIDAISFNPAVKTVLGANTTFTASASNVSFATHIKKDAIGANATFKVTNPTISIVPAKTNVKATASGTAVSVNTGQAIIGIDTPTTASFVTSYPGVTNKLVTTAITEVGGTTNVTKISTNDSITATKINSFGTQAALTVTYTEETETLEMTWTPNAIATGTDVTATKTVYETVSVAIPAENDTIVATGGVSSSGTGGMVMTGLGTAEKASAVTAMGAITKSSFATGIKSVTQPTIALAASSTGGTGIISLVSGITSASASGTNVTFNDRDIASTITELGAATAEAQTIIIGYDNVSALTSATTLTKS